MGVVDGAGRVRHRIGSRLGLGEGDHLADVLLPDEQRRESVDSEGEATVRRCAEPEGIEQEAELGPLLLCADAEDLEDPRLDLGPVDTDAARAELPAVEHQVVGLRPDVEPPVALGRVQKGHVVDVGHRERVMSGNGITVDHVLEQRKIGDPQEVEATVVDRRAAELQPQQPQDPIGGPPSVGDEEHHVAGLGPEALLYARELGLAHELRQAAFETVVADPEPGQALGPPPLGLVGELVDGVAAEALGAAGHADALDDRGLEHVGLGVLEQVGQLFELHAEAHVGLVGAVPLHGLGPRHVRELGGALPRDRLGGFGHGLRHELEDVVLGDEAGFDVELHELELAVGPQVLVP